MDTLCRLVCGAPAEYGEAGLVVRHLNESIAAFGAKASALLAAESSPEITLFGPFCARVLMETGCAAILGRFDPFRILYLSRFQSHAGYDPTKRANSAFAWQGDVLADKEREELWGNTVETSRVSRALLSQHLEHLYWRPAVLAALDCAAEVSSNPYVADFLSTASETFIPEAKGRGMAIYSQLSKGVHWEFFNSALTLFDEASVKEAIRDSVKWMARLALVSHFVPTAMGRLDGNVAVADYASVLELINAR
jgi:hypothetical protein